MPGKAEFRKLAVDFPHQAVACDFGDDAGCRDRKREPVALDDGVMRHGETAHRQAVDQAMVGQGIDGLDRAAHREMGGAQDVEAVDFPAIGQRHRPDDIRISGELVIEGIPPRRGDFFGIIEAWTGIIPWQDDGGGGHRPGQWSASRLIHTRDALQATGME